ncbi:MAG: T9SS type A sorting domain-containing protein [Saprospiraceae bacterium]
MTAWRKALTPVNLAHGSAWFHLLPSPDGSGFDAVGVRQDKDIGFIISGWAAHMDWEGDIVWQRYDTVYVDTGLWINENKLFNLAHLSSGSIVGAGYVRSATPYGHNEGWLIKWSANGCLAPGDCATVSTHDDLSGDTGKRLDGWDLFPNPARGHTWLSQPDGVSARNVTLHITDPSGRVVRDLEYAHSLGGQYEVPLDGLGPGLYFYQVFLDGKPRHSGRLVII